jgi:hypothetical protein
MLPSRVGDEQPLPFHTGFEPPTSRFGISTQSQSRTHSHRRSSSFNAPRNRSRERAPPSQNAPYSTVTQTESQGGNLNRWSKSTEGSTASTTHKRSNSFSRRMSLSAGGNTFLDSPPRKLQKSRPPTANSSPSQIKITRPPGIDPALITLPPINTLPNLQTSLSSSSPSIGPTTPSPSTAQILSAAARSVDYFSRYEDSSLGSKDLSYQRGPSTSRSTNFGPSPIGRQPAVDGKGLTQQDGEDERAKSRGHSRNRSQAGKSSTGTNNSSKRSSKQPSQKAMLSKALQKANTAVLLDNAQNFEGAMQAYSEACSLLQQVMLRSSGDDDRRKLEAIVSH